MSGTSMQQRTADAPVPGVAGLALKIGVMGGAADALTSDQLRRAHELGRAIALNRCILITGACGGLPLSAACGAKEYGALVVGISPGLSLDEHIRKYRSPTEFHDVLVFTGSGLMGREVVNIRTSDVVVIVGGKTGTLGELAISYDEGKLIGVLTGTGGVADIAHDVLAACAKDTGARVVYDDDPRSLLDELLRVYRTEHYRRPSCFCEGDVSSVATSLAVVDPVCGMRLLRDAATVRRIVGDVEYALCSATCALAFDADPHRYAEKGSVHA